jgi:hypothetical protein
LNSVINYALYPSCIIEIIVFIDVFDKNIQNTTEIEDVAKQHIKPA